MKWDEFTEEELKKIEKNIIEERNFRKCLSKLLSGDSHLASEPLLIGVTPNAIECGIEYLWQK